LQPHAPPPPVIKHCAPIMLAEHATHAPPLAPHCALVVPATQLLLKQQPPLHSWVAVQVVVHRCSRASHASPGSQSAAELQPHAFETHRWPFALALQSMHTPPDGPHTVAVVPAAQLPPLQQPPLHGWVAEHTVTHACEVASHDEPDWQSAVELQPQVPPFAPPPVMHSLPRLDIEQSRHAPPALPQALAAVPPAQVPPAQQPPLHGCVAEHAVTHWCAPTSQASPAGQSPVTLQPQPLPMHAWPRLLAEQSVHALPLLPQVAPAVPPLQVPPAQQPPLHGWPALQVVVQWLVPSHA
jgi:hypothetical protein